MTIFNNSSEPLVVDAAVITAAFKATVKRVISKPEVARVLNDPNAQVASHVLAPLDAGTAVEKQAVEFIRKMDSASRADMRTLYRQIM